MVEGGGGNAAIKLLFEAAALKRPSQWQIAGHRAASGMPQRRSLGVCYQGSRGTSRPTLRVRHGGRSNVKVRRGRTGESTTWHTKEYTRVGCAPMEGPMGLVGTRSGGAWASGASGLFGPSGEKTAAPLARI